MAKLKRIPYEMGLCDPPVHRRTTKNTRPKKARKKARLSGGKKKTAGRPVRRPL